MVRKNFKEFTGLKKTTSNELLIKLTGFDFEDFSEKMSKLAEYRWERRCGKETLEPIFEENTEMKNYVKYITNHLNWDVICCWNLLLGVRPARNSILGDT